MGPLGFKPAGFCTAGKLGVLVGNGANTGLAGAAELGPMNELVPSVGRVAAGLVIAVAGVEVATGAVVIAGVAVVVPIGATVVTLGAVPCGEAGWVSAYPAVGAAIRATIPIGRVRVKNNDRELGECFIVRLPESDTLIADKLMPQWTVVVAPYIPRT